MSFEDYRKKHYQKQFGEAQRILAEVTNGVDSEAFKVCLPILLDKMWTPEVYLREAYEKSGGPEVSTGPSPRQPPSHLPGAGKDLIRHPTQTPTVILPDEYDRLVEITDSAVYPKEYIRNKQDWRGINDILKQYGYKWVSEGKDSRWEKQ